MLLVMDPRGERDRACPASATTEPTFGLPAMWIDEALREEALVPRLHRGRSRRRCITTHLTEVVKDNMPSCCPTPRRRSCWTSCGKEHQKLVADIIPSQISVGGVQRVLQNLLAERVSIRDLPTILEGIVRGLRLHPQRHG